ncbi:MAG: sensor histidine kinase [Actinomycetota bacterium]
MRRRLNWLVLAITGLLVVAFVMPLGLLVRRQAMERAQVAAEQRAQSTAAALAVATAGGQGELTPDMAEAALVAEAGVILPDGRRLGPVEIPAALASRLREGLSGSVTEGGSWYIGLPVATPQGVIGVVAEATAGEMSAGVGEASLILAGLALVLILGSVVMADRLGRTVVSPTRSLSEVANRLAEGELEARAEVSGPPEIQRVAQALNGLASRLESIIAGEREALADLSHRLRTPLTALRLEAERLGPGQDPGGLLRQVDRTEEAVDQLIQEVRERGRSAEETVDVAEVVGRQLGFWSVLASEQGRTLSTELDAGPLPLRVDRAELVAALDALVGNVFQHTPPGTAFSVEVANDRGTPVVAVTDEGPGIPGSGVMERGASTGGSTGLGLDIARALCERLGGRLETGEGPDGGALVRMRLGA